MKHLHSPVSYCGPVSSSNGGCRRGAGPTRVHLGDKVCVFGAKVHWSHADRGDKGDMKGGTYGDDDEVLSCFLSPGEDLFRGKVKTGEREQDVSGK